MPVRIALPDGGDVLMNLASVNDQIEVYDMAEAKTNEIEWIRYARDKLNERAIDTFDFGTIPASSLPVVYRFWIRASEDEAVPFESGSSSDTPPSPPRSPAPTAKGGRRARRASS